MFRVECLNDLVDGSIVDPGYSMCSCIKNEREADRSIVTIKNSS